MDKKCIKLVMLLFCASIFVSLGQASETVTYIPKSMYQKYDFSYVRTKQFSHDDQLQFFKIRLPPLYKNLKIFSQGLSLIKNNEYLLKVQMHCEYVEETGYTFCEFNVINSMIKNVKFEVYYFNEVTNDIETIYLLGVDLQ